MHDQKGRLSDVHVGNDDNDDGSKGRVLTESNTAGRKGRALEATGDPHGRLGRRATIFPVRG